jgi:dolichol-phosphate mannosyltransferase
MKLSVVIPAHNEEETVAETVEGLVATLSREGIDHEVIVVDDSSMDGTAAVVERIGARCAAFPPPTPTGSASPSAQGWRRSRGMPSPS